MGSADAPLALGSGGELGGRRQLRRGRRLGHRTALRWALRNVLAQRFGSVSPLCERAIDVARTRRLQRWIRRALQVATLDEVIGIENGSRSCR